MLAKWSQLSNKKTKPFLITSLDSDLIAPMVAVYTQLARDLASSCTCTRVFKLFSSFSKEYLADSPVLIYRHLFPQEQSLKIC